VGAAAVTVRVRLAVVVARAVLVVGVTIVVSVVGGATSIVGAGVAVTDGSLVAGGDVAGGAVVGCAGASCARPWVEESARAAAIAGRALVNAYWCAFLIIRNNRVPGVADAILSPVWPASSTNDRQP
jgi:hypothetical protein